MARAAGADERSWQDWSEPAGRPAGRQAGRRCSLTRLPELGCCLLNQRLPVQAARCPQDGVLILGVAVLQEGRGRGRQVGRRGVSERAGWSAITWRCRAAGGGGGAGRQACRGRGVQVRLGWPGADYALVPCL